MVLQPAAAFWGISCQQTTPAFRWKITLLDNGAGKHCFLETLMHLVTGLEIA